MFGLGPTETIIIIVVALLIFGSQAPKLVGKFFGTAKAVKEEVEKNVADFKTDVKKENDKIAKK